MPRRPTHLLLPLAVVVGAALAAPLRADAQETVPVPPAIDRTDMSPWELPVRPPLCNEAQLAMGDVRACVVLGSNDPATRGWASPPAPLSGDASGWVWNGYSYSGSPALIEWETTIISENAQRLDRVRAGRLQTNIGAATLFEGFLAEVIAGGYRLNDASGYGYRCTAGSGGWDCPSGNPSGLSLHSWGLAIDINGGTNPVITLRDPDGGNACAVPMVTDMPQWVIQTAEKWGLYWGGYGWSGDCLSPDDVRESSYRDPPHFEFRGTPEAAERIARFNLRNDPTLGCYDVIDADGTERLRCNHDFTVEAGWRVAIDPHAPQGAVAAVVNLTATGGAEHGFLTLESCAARPAGMPATSNVNYERGHDVANLATVTLDPDGRFCIYHDTVVHAIVDVIGFIVDADDAVDDVAWFSPVDPIRVGDTRKREVCLRDGRCESGPVSAREVATIPISGDSAVLANLTVTDNHASGYVSAADCALFDGDVPEWSNLNYSGENARANLAIIDTSTSGAACAYTWADTHLIVDVLGTIGDEGLGWMPVEAERVLDTRRCDEARCAHAVAAGEVIELDLGDGTDAAIVNVTATGAASDGFATLAACSTLRAVTAMPITSTVNVDRGSTAANMAVAADDGSGVCLWASTPMHLIVDVQATLVDDQIFGFVGSDPSRVYDGRRGG
jgi:hypothetical protein